MTDKEKIKAEVIRLIDELIQAPYKSEFDDGRISAFKHMELFIDSLPEESVSKDLEEETIKKYIQEHLVSHDTLYKGTIDELEVYEQYDLLLIAKWAAKWQKEQMMAKSIERRVFLEWGKEKIELYQKDLEGLKFGDKVKIIIIKEDKQ